MELTFRLLALAMGVTYMTVRSVYERKLKRPSKREQLRQADSRDRLDLTLVGVGTLPMWLYMGTPWLDFAAMGLPVPVRVAGFIAAALGGVLLAASHHALAANWSPFVEDPGAGTLVTDGIYRYVRHPMYASFLVYNAGMWLLSSNWMAGAPALLTFVWLYLRRVDREERMMLGLFGEEYRAYAARTGRVIPGVGRSRLAGERVDNAAA